MTATSNWNEQLKYESDTTNVEKKTADRKSVQRQENVKIEGEQERLAVSSITMGSNFELVQIQLGDALDKGNAGSGNEIAW